MCIFFLSPDCSLADFESTVPLSRLFSSSRRSSSNETITSVQSLMSSLSNTTTMSSNGSSDSLRELNVPKESSQVPTSDHTTKHFRIPVASEWDWGAVLSSQEDSSASEYVTAINTLTNILENKSGVQIGRCLDPTSPVPSLCKNLQIRHRSSSKRQTGYFEKCEKCTSVGKEWQESRSEESITWEEFNHSLNSAGQKVLTAKTGMCSLKGCDGCRPTTT